MKFILSIIMMAVSCVSYALLSKPVDLKVADGFVNPVGYSLENMSFSWKLPQGDNVKQSAYRIQVVSDIGYFDLNDVDLDRIRTWDSGKVASSQSVKVPFDKKRKLLSQERLYWRVKYWDAEGGESEWSDVNFFEAGILENRLDADWISGGFPKTKMYTLKLGNNNYKTAPKTEVQPTYFRKAFSAVREVKSARLYVASLGIFQAYINGEKVGDDFWGTGWTDYNKRVQCNAYDVTSLIKKGKNANVIGAILADGWYAGMIGWRHSGVYGDIPKLQMLLDIEYDNGMVETVATGKDWKWSYGPVTYSDIYMGEKYDARLEMEGWNKNPSFDDSDWRESKIEKIDVLTQPRRNTPVRAMGELSPKSVVKVADKTYVFDMGQNMVGLVNLKFRAPKGSQIMLRYAEMLNKDGTLYTENYRAAASRDYIISKGGKTEWSPLFTFHGFRYVEVSGLDYTPSAADLKGVVLYNDMDTTGGFECSDELVNKLQSNIIWGQKSNFFSVPTDCPQRDERLGWTGDASVFVQTAAFNMDTNAFYAKWCVDLLDEQTADGKYTWIAPSVFWNDKNGVRTMRSNGAPVWCDAGILIPWEVYMAYGDKKILENNYDGIKKWIDWQKDNSKDFIRGNHGFGDWLQPKADNGKMTGDASNSLIATAYFAYTANLFSRIADILGKKKDAATYAKLSDDVKKAFADKFIKPDGSLESNSQTAYLLALNLDIVPQNMRGKVFDKLVQRLEKDNFHLNTGFVGTPHLNPVLTKFGRHDLACRLLFNKTYPSWLYPVMQGATTMWERWNSYSHKDGFGDANMNSFNHYAYGAIGQWMYKNIGGLWYDEAGYKRILFAPVPDARISGASVWHITPYGRASSKWNVENGVFKWTIVIPSNSEGRVVFRTKDVASILVNGKALKALGKSGEGFPEAVLPSGTYNIEYKL